MLRAIGRIAWKDVVGDFRRRATVASMVFFALSVLVVFQAGFNPDRVEAVRLMPGLLWVTVLFTVMVGLGRVFQDEEEDGGIELLLLSPTPRGAIFLGKWAGNVILTLVVELFLLPLIMVLFNVDAWDRFHLLFGTLFLGSLGISTLGVLLSALTTGTRSRETLLALLLMPLVAPLLIAGVQVTIAILNGGDVGPWLRLIAIFDVIYLVLAPWGFGWLVQE